MALKRFMLIFIAFFFYSTHAQASTTVTMHSTNGKGSHKVIGTVTFTPTKWGGVLITPKLHSLKAGTHGFHIHEKPSCDDKGMAAGGHLDPKQTGNHLGPYDDAGHLGDLPVLVVTKDGTSTTPTYAPRLSMEDINNRSLMIHKHGDNYSDQPKKLGGGGERVACGLINRTS